MSNNNKCLLINFQQKYTHEIRPKNVPSIVVIQVKKMTIIKLKMVMQVENSIIKCNVTMLSFFAFMILCAFFVLKRKNRTNTHFKKFSIFSSKILLLHSKF